MGLMNISIPYLPTPLPANVGLNGTYQRVDTPNNPVVNVNGITGYPADLTPSGVNNGQYNWTLTPVYADGRTCPPLSGSTPACPSMIAVSAAQVGSNIVVTYTAPSSVSTVQVTINTPNGGQFVQTYTNGNPIVYTPQTGVYGNFTVSMQAVCDSVTGFFGSSASGGTVSISAPITNPTLSGTMSVVCPNNCNGQQSGSIQFNLVAPLSADLTVQMALQYTTPTGQQQYGCSLLPPGDITGTCNATGYASFIIPAGILQINIPEASIRFSTGLAAFSLICFCPSNPDYGTIFMNTMFLHPANQPNININVTAIDTRITITQI